MSDPISQAKTARQNLAQGLSALQSPGVPEQLRSGGGRGAEARSPSPGFAFSQGGAPGKPPAALAAVRRALSLLQGHAGLEHPAVNQATEAIAGALGMVHSLSKAASSSAQPAVAQPAAAPGGQPASGGFGQFPSAAPRVAAAAAPAGFGATAVIPPQAAAQPQAPVPQAPVPQAPVPQAPVPQQAPPWAQPQQPVAPVAQQQPVAVQQPVAPVAQPQPAQVPQQAAPAAGWQQPQQAWPAQPAGQQAHPSHPHAQAQPHPGSHPQAAAGSHPQAAPGPAVPIQAPPNTRRIEANLGAHSPTNFYKGLSGNDVIDAGGIFVETYQIPAMSESLVVHVSLPGGYEFEALAVVEWVREAPASTAGVEAPPGFGAKFTQISPEGRQLVYRYVRNREPLFHDDL